MPSLFSSDMPALSEERTFPHWRTYPPCGLVRDRCTYAVPVKLQTLTHKSNSSWPARDTDAAHHPHLPVRYYAVESSSQRVMFSLVEQETGHSKTRFYILSDSKDTPLMHIKRIHHSDTVWEGYDSWTHELLFRMKPAPLDPSNVMHVVFRDSAAVSDADMDEKDPDTSPAKVRSDDLRDPPTLPRLTDFEADWTLPSDRHPGGYDKGEVLSCLLSNWRVLHSRERVYLFTGQCSRSDRLAEAVLAPRFDLAFGAAISFICAIQQAAGFLSS